MKRLCESCEKRPAVANHFLCYGCKRSEDRADSEAVELQTSREFKFEMREATTIPAMQRRYM
jgi:hypothetical protein